MRCASEMKSEFESTLCPAGQSVAPDQTSGPLSPRERAGVRAGLIGYTDSTPRSKTKSAVSDDAIAISKSKVTGPHPGPLPRGEGVERLRVPIETETIGCHTLTRRAKCAVERLSTLCCCAVNSGPLSPRERARVRAGWIGCTDSTPRSKTKSAVSDDAIAISKSKVVGPHPGPLPRGEGVKRRHAGGFSLLEVLAALLLVAIVLPVLMGALNTATHIGGLAQDRAEAARLAENKINEILLDESWQFGDDTGEFEVEDEETGQSGRYTWVLQVEEWLDPSVRKLTMTVRWERRGRPQTITLTTAVHDESDT